MKKILLGLLLVLSTVVLADGYGFTVEENLGYYGGESVYDEFGNNKCTGQTREYELRQAEKNKNSINDNYTVEKTYKIKGVIVGDDVDTKNVNAIIGSCLIVVENDQNLYNIIMDTENSDVIDVIYDRKLNKSKFDDSWMSVECIATLIIENKSKFIHIENLRRMYLMH